MPPKTNPAYWAEKISGNQRRDRDTDARLSGSGWTVVRVWEHEDPGEAALRIQLSVRSWADHRHPLPEETE